MKKPRLRLFVPQGFAVGASCALSEAQAHYVGHVMRAGLGESVRVFNGVDGEWLADISHISKKQVAVTLVRQLAVQKPSPDVWLVFAPIKNKVDFIVEKATELGASQLHAVYSRHAVVKSLNHEKLAAYAVEAAEQCERMDVPTVCEHKDLAALLAAWPKDRVLLHADEGGAGADLKSLLPTLSTQGAYAVLVGPEGGFSHEERVMLKAHPQVKAYGLGPRILRADTAVVASLACVQAWLGDWTEQPFFEAAS